MDPHPQNIKNVVLKGFFWVFLASFITYIFQFVAKIFLARILLPEDFGLFAIGLMIIFFIGMIQDLGISNAIVQKKEEIEKSFNTATIFLLILGILLSLFFLNFINQISDFFDNPKLSKILFFLFLTIPLSSLTIIYNSFVAKKLLFYNRFLLDIIPILVNSILSIFLAYNNFGYMSLVYGYVAGTIILLIMGVLIVKIPLKLQFDLQSLKKLLSYGKNILIVNFIVVILTHGDNFIIGKVLGSEELGYYVMAYGFASIPVTQISHVLSKVLFPTFAELQNNTELLKKSYYKSIELISTAVFPVSLGIFITAPYFVKSVLGDKWIPIITVLSTLSFMGLVKAQQVIPSFFLQATGHAKKDKNINIIILVLMLILVYPLTIKYNIFGTAICMLISYSAGTIIYFNSINKILSWKYTEVLKRILPAIISSLLMILLIKIILIFINSSNDLTKLITSIIVGGISYIVFILIFSKTFKKECKFLINKILKHNL